MDDHIPVRGPNPAVVALIALQIECAFVGHEGEGGHGFARAPEMARADRDQGSQISVRITCVEPAVPPHHRQASQHIAGQAIARVGVRAMAPRGPAADQGLRHQAPKAGGDHQGVELRGDLHYVAVGQL